MIGVAKVTSQRAEVDAESVFEAVINAIKQWRSRRQREPHRHAPVEVKLEDGRVFTMTALSGSRTRLACRRVEGRSGEGEADRAASTAATEREAMTLDLDDLERKARAAQRSTSWADDFKYRHSFTPDVTLALIAELRAAIASVARLSDPPPFWQHAITECNEAHVALDAYGVSTTERVRRVRGPKGEQDITIGLARRVHELGRERDALRAQLTAATTWSDETLWDAYSAAGTADEQSASDDAERAVAVPAAMRAVLTGQEPK